MKRINGKNQKKRAYRPSRISKVSLFRAKYLERKTLLQLAEQFATSTETIIKFERDWGIYGMDELDREYQRLRQLALIGNKKSN